jgi:hypothetical protein
LTGKSLQQREPVTTRWGLRIVTFHPLTMSVTGLQLDVHDRVVSAVDRSQSLPLCDTAQKPPEVGQRCTYSPQKLAWTWGDVAHYVWSWFQINNG